MSTRIFKAEDFQILILKFLKKVKLSNSIKGYSSLSIADEGSISHLACIHDGQYRDEQS